jgi:fructokinase
MTGSTFFFLNLWKNYFSKAFSQSSQRVRRKTRLHGRDFTDCTDDASLLVYVPKVRFVVKVCVVRDRPVFWRGSRQIGLYTQGKKHYASFMIIACGEALIDMVSEKDKAGREIYVPCPGGSPYNTAIAIGRILGAENGKRRTAFLSRLSRDFFGEILVRRLEQNNVSTALTARSGQNTTLAFVKVEEGKEPAYIFYTENSADRSLEPSDIPAELPAGTSCILFGSISLTMESSATTIENFIFRESGREGGPVISHDPNVRPLMIPNRSFYVNRFEKWVHASDIVKISSADFDFIYPGMGAEKGAEKLIGLGPRLVIVTFGEEGAASFFVREGTISRVNAPAFHPPVVDTIGAGDTFHGAFLSWLEENGRMFRKSLDALSENEIREALIFANKVAAIVCSRKGADPPLAAEIKAFQ